MLVCVGRCASVCGQVWECVGKCASVCAGVGVCGQVC